MAVSSAFTVTPAPFSASAAAAPSLASATSSRSVVTKASPPDLESVSAAAKTRAVAGAM